MAVPFLEISTNPLKFAVSSDLGFVSNILSFSAIILIEVWDGISVKYSLYLETGGT